MGNRRQRWERFREQTHHLAQYARQQLVDLVGREPLVPDSRQWYGSMAHVPLPPGDAASLQQALWSEHRIEVPIITWNSRRWIRVSCHLYNTPEEIDRLVDALRDLLYRKMQALGVGFEQEKTEETEKGLLGSLR